MTALAVWLDGDSVDGANNATLVNGDPVTTWVNRGSIVDNPTQATGASKPTFITGGIAGKPVVRFDGGDFLRAVTASNYTFMHDGTGCTIYTVVKTGASALGNIVATSTGAGTSRGVGQRLNTLFRASFFMSDGAALQVLIEGANNTVGTNVFDVLTNRIVNETPPARIYVNGTEVVSGGTPTFSALAPAFPLAIGARGDGALPITGDLAQVLIYAAAHDATQRAAVLAYFTAKYGTFPVA